MICQLFSALKQRDRFDAVIFSALALVGAEFFLDNTGNAVVEYKYSAWGLCFIRAAERFISSLSQTIRSSVDIFWKSMQAWTAPQMVLN